MEVLFYFIGGAIALGIVIASFFPRISAYVLGPALLIIAATGFVSLFGIGTKSAGEVIFFVIVLVAVIGIGSIGLSLTVAGRRPDSTKALKRSYAQALRNALSFKGRATFGEFWTFVLGTSLGVAPLVFFASAALGKGEQAVLFLLIAMPLLYVPIAVRRLHDSGYSGLWLLVVFVPVVGVLVLLILLSAAGQLGKNRFGLDQALSAWEAERRGIIEERHRRLKARDVRADARYFRDRPDSDVHSHVSQVTALPEEDTERWGLHLPDSEIHRLFVESASMYAKQLWEHIHSLRSQRQKSA